MALTPADVLARIERYRPFLSGITVSGGECGLQSFFLEALLREADAMGLPGLVDTNGSTDYSLHPGLVAAAAGFMLDVKAWDDAEHGALTGASNATVLANLRFLADARKLYEVRTVVVPGRFNAEATVREVSRALAASGSDARYKLIRFRPQGVRAAWRGLPTPDDATMDALASIARASGAREIVVV
jgi:pyruvate formate lyase activating enzyme